jgi:hypothetical protein
MRSFIVAGALSAVLTGSANAQFGYLGPGGNGQGGYGYGGMAGAFAPNFYNPQNQPLSPYLNLLRGGNTAVNYYYGTRPGLPSGGFIMPYGISPGAIGRQTFFPQLDTIADEEEDHAKTGEGLRPTGHAFGFNNQLGYFGTGSGMRGQGQGQGLAGQKRTGSSGIR